MGGSGGGFSGNWFPHKPKIDELVRQSGEETRERSSSTEIEQVINDKLRDINDHDYEKISDRRDDIEKKLKSSFEDAQVLARYGGSYSRHTNVSGISDVDILVQLGDGKDVPSSSDTAIKQVADILRERYPNTNITQGKMAVTVTFSDGMEIQVLPSYRVGEGVYRIPDPNSNGWIQTCPIAFSNRLTQVNQQNNGKLVPLIKLAKSICDNSGVPISSYHLENMAVQIFSTNNGSITTQHQMLQHFFNQAKRLCLRPMADICGQSPDVAGSITHSERLTISSRLSSIEERIQTANETGSSKQWNEILK